MKKLYLFYSKTSKYLDFIDQYQKMDLSLLLICIEDILDKKLIFNQNDVVYLMINDRMMIEDFINKYNEKVKIINQSFYDKKISKVEIQKLLNSNIFFTPKIIENINITPYFLKTNNHQGINKIINSIDELKDYNQGSYYCEEIIDYQIEKKLYYVYEGVFTKKGVDFDDIDLQICKDIASKLDFEIMSIDVLYKNNQRYVIDVNVSPAFFKTKNGRETFVKRALE